MPASHKIFKKLTRYETQHSREIWFYVMSGGAVLKIATMELARIIL